VQHKGCKHLRHKANRRRQPSQSRAVSAHQAHAGEQKQLCHPTTLEQTPERSENPAVRNQPMWSSISAMTLPSYRRRSFPALQTLVSLCCPQLLARTHTRSAAYNTILEMTSSKGQTGTEVLIQRAERPVHLKCFKPNTFSHTLHFERFHSTPPFHLPLHGESTMAITEPSLHQLLRTHPRETEQAKAVNWDSPPQKQQDYRVK